MSHKPDSWTYGKPEANEWYGEFISVHSAERDDERLALVWDEEDARLIAASPDLLKWGEHNLLCYKNLRTACGLTNDLEDIREMEAALAKAKGE